MYDCIIMNFITTNIRIPEEVYMEIKLEAAKRRKSFAFIVRERIIDSLKESKRTKNKSDLES